MIGKQHLLHFVILFIVLVTPSVKAQLSWKVNAEAGYYNSSSNSILNTGDFLTRFEGKLGYQHQYKRNSASVQFKFRPEIYGFEKQMTSLKFKGIGSYSQNLDDLNWGINLTRQIHKFTFPNLDFTYDILILRGDLTLFTIHDFPISVNLGYAYQNFSSAADQNLDLLFAEVKLTPLLNQYFKIGYGFYAEKFLIENQLSFYEGQNSQANSGLRIGPAVDLNYLKDFIFNVQYRILLHNSDLTGYPSYEQWIRLVAGKIFFQRFSAFLLVDYYSRKFRFNNESDDKNLLVYTPLNLENHFHIKAAYDLKKTMEIYLKGGYFQENLIFNNLSFNGWNLILGMELRN